MKVWTVICCGDGEAYSAWVTQDLAWQGALALAERIRQREEDSGYVRGARVVVSNEGHEAQVEVYTSSHDWHERHTVRVASVEVKGDVVTELGKLA